MRNTFIDTLVKKAQTNQNIALIVGDLGYSVVEKFAQSFPNRFFNAGVAEQNMAGMAAGLASEGFHVFIYSIANFPTFRCAEQIRNDIDYHNLPVTIVSVGAGLSYGNMGYSHHAIQDMALMRLFPNILIAAPADPLEVESCLNFLIENPQPSYLRLGKTGELKITKIVSNIKPGEIYCQIDKGPGKKLILTTGTGLNVAINLVEKGVLENNSIYTMPMWGANFRKNQIHIMEKYDEITTVETHLLDGGFGSWLSECSRKNSNKIKKIYIDSRVIYSSATNEKLLEKFIIQEQ